MSIVAEYVPKTTVPTEEAIMLANQFEAPALLQMQPVVYFAKGWRNQDQYPAWAVTGNVTEQKDPVSGEMRKVTNLTTRLFVAGLGYMNHVPNIDDPRLGWNNDQRARGAWDFTSDDKAKRAQAVTVEKMLDEAKLLLARVEEIAKSATAPKAQPKTQAKSE